MISAAAKPSRPLAGLVILAAVVATGLAGEFAVRLAQPELDPTRHLRFEQGTGDVPVLGLRGAEQRQIKNTGDFDVKVRFNKYGLRDPKDLATGMAEDVFLVGDSFTFGWGVEEKDRISERLEALIGRRVFNLSVPTGIDGYDMLLKYAEANGAKVRNVVICVSMETDIIDYDGAAPTKDSPDAPPADPGLVRWTKVFLTANSALYMLSTTLVHRSPILKAMAARAGLLTPNLAGIRQFEFSDKAIASSARRATEIARRYRATVAVLPSRALWFGPRQAIEKRRHEAFVAHLRALGLSVVDLRPAFEEGGNPLSYHFANDPHWKPAGHALAARALAPAVSAALKAR